MTKQDWANGFRWMRDKFAGWLASVTVFSFLWIAVIVAVSVLFVWDGVWSRHQAPSSLDPLTFQAAGWTLRLWTVFGLAAALWCFRHAAHWVGGFFIVTWIATSVMTYGHALGFMMGGQAERYATGAVAEKTVEITTTSLDDQIAELEKQKAEIRADLLLAVTPLNEEIKRLDTDGKLNEELANKQKARRDTLQDVAAGKIEALDRDIRDLRLNHKADQIAGTEAVAVAAKFDPLYLTLAEWTDGKPGRPDDETARAIGQKTGAFWALLVEMIGGLGAALLYSVHAHMAARKPKGDVTETVSDDLHEVRMTDAELEAYQKHRKRSEAAALKARIPIEGKEAIQGMVNGIRHRYKTGASPHENFKASKFATWHEFENFVNKMFNASAAAKILGVPKDGRKPDPRSSTKTDAKEWVPLNEDPEPPVAGTADAPEPEGEEVFALEEPEAESVNLVDQDTALEGNDILSETPEPPQANGAYGVAVWKSNPPAVLDPEQEAEDGDRV